MTRLTRIAVGLRRWACQAARTGAADELATDLRIRADVAWLRLTEQERVAYCCHFAGISVADFERSYGGGL